MAEAEDEFQHALKKNMFQKAAFAFKVEEINQAMAEVKANMEEDQAEFTDAQCRKKLKRRNTNQEDEESCVDDGGKRRRQKEAREQLKGPLPLTEFNLRAHAEEEERVASFVGRLPRRPYVYKEISLRGSICHERSRT